MIDPEDAARQEGYEEGKQAGIKEVVDYIEAHYNKDITLADMMGLDCWNEKLKEWGIDAD